MANPPGDFLYYAFLVESPPLRENGQYCPVEILILLQTLYLERQVIVSDRNALQENMKQGSKALSNDQKLN